jgi:hypothetical protein
MVRQVERDARGAECKNQMNDPPLKMPYEKRLKMFELDYFRGNQILYGTEKAILQFEIVKHLYPQMCATPATPAVEAGNPFDASGNEREAFEISATIDSAENQRLRFPHIPAQFVTKLTTCYSQSYFTQ